MFGAGLLESRRDVVAADPVLTALTATVRARIERVLREEPLVPARKALLTRDGGVCPEDHAPLRFDPWNGSAHRCDSCGRAWTGERHDGHWARAQHLWVAERALDLAALAALEGDEEAARRSAALLAAQGEVYLELPNRDNVLGPTHLFFSTYLESLWITNWLAAAFLLRETGLLPDAAVEVIDRVAEESAALIGEFNEGLSNRQVWHAAALAAIAAWFGDEDLLQTAVESRTGLLGLLADGFDGDDGMWWEGENYHLFALRGLMVGMQWSSAAGIDLLQDPELRRHFERALLAPSLTALPDLTYPARKDSRFGVSLAQPAFLELWEIGRAWLAPHPGLDAWLAALYPRGKDPADHYDAWLHQAGLPARDAWTRSDLSAWSLLALDPTPLSEGPHQPVNVLVASQGLAVLRQDGRYASLECGAAGGGHGHPDRLHLSLFAGGVPWLPDQGTGSYVDPSLFWYRSPRAHNAPSLDGESPATAHCDAFDVQGAWAWVRGRAGDVTRTLVSGPGIVVDFVDLDANAPRALELPWHLQGEWRVTSGGAWEATDAGIEGAERLLPDRPGLVVVESRDGEARIRLHFAGAADLIRAPGPGLPGRRSPRPFLALRQQATTARLVTVIETEPAERTEVRPAPEGVVVERDGVATQIRVGVGGATVTVPDGKVELGGRRPAPGAPAPLFTERPSWDARAVALPAWDRPALDGTLDGFDLDAPLSLDGEHQYRRSEEPYDPERFAATAWINWDVEAIYLAVEVAKDEVVVRDAGAAPLELDNEADDIHLDGMQVYFRWPDGSVAGFVVVPDPSGMVRSRAIEPAGESRIEGRWAHTDGGYCMTVALTDPRIGQLRAGERLGFDLLVNEMTGGRVRRLGQLVWSGGGGWVYLRGDRQHPDHFGRVDLQ